MTMLEKELFDFCKELVNHISKDGYDLLKKMYVLEKKLEENGGVTDASIHDLAPKKDLTQDIPDDLSDDREIDHETGEVFGGYKETDLPKDDATNPLKQDTIASFDELDDLPDNLTGVTLGKGIYTDDLPDDDLPF